jgi:hypothetical protein
MPSPSPLTAAQNLLSLHTSFEAWSLTGHGVDAIIVGPGGERDWQ